MKTDKALHIDTMYDEPMDYFLDTNIQPQNLVIHSFLKTFLSVLFH